MREVPVTIAKARFAELLRDVERGESIAITRNGTRVAVLAPIDEYEREQRQKAVDRFMEMRSTWKPTGVSTEEILSWRHEGHRY